MSGVKQVTVQAISPQVVDRVAERRRELARQMEEGTRQMAELERDLEQARQRVEGLEAQAERARASLAAVKGDLEGLRETSRALERRRAQMQDDTLAAREEAHRATAGMQDEVRALEADLEALRSQQRSLQQQRAELSAAADALDGAGLREARSRFQEVQERREAIASAMEAYRVRLEAWSSDPRHGAMVEALAEAAAQSGFRPVRTLKEAGEIRLIFEDAARRTLHVALQAPSPERELPPWVVTPGRFATDGDCVGTFEDLLRNLAARGVLATGSHMAVDAPAPCESQASPLRDGRVRE